MSLLEQHQWAMWRDEGVASDSKVLERWAHPHLMLMWLVEGEEWAS
jgi:hypothetical protein